MGVLLLNILPKLGQSQAEHFRFLGVIAEEGGVNFPELGQTDGLNGLNGGLPLAEPARFYCLTDCAI